MHGKVIVIDEERCNGCMLCAIACSIAHFGDIRLERAHIKVGRTQDERFVPLTCHHCETPSCAAACPTTACRREPAAGRVIIDEKKCIACRTCAVACPFGHAHYDAVARVCAKCDYCDGEPECVRVCEPGALSYVYSDEGSLPKRRASAVAQARLGPPGRPVLAYGIEEAGIGRAR